VGGRVEMKDKDGRIRDTPFHFVSKFKKRMFKKKKYIYIYILTSTVSAPSQYLLSMK
jgi:hypothetical protein